MYVLLSRLNKTKCLTHDYPQALLKSKLCYGKKNSSIRVFSRKCDLFSRSLACEWRLQANYHSLCFLFSTPWKHGAATITTIIALSLTKLLLFLNQLSNCKSNILNRDPHFMLTITPSLSPVIGKASECFVRAKRSKIHWKWVVLAWASNRFSMLRVSTCTPQIMVSYFFILTRKLATTKRALTSNQ